MCSVASVLTFSCLSGLAAVSLQAADPPPPVLVSAASSTVGVAPDALASIFGSQLSTVIAQANGLPWPNQLGDIPVIYVSDAAGNTKMASILFVSPSQINIKMPAGLTPGPATLQFPYTGLPPGVGAAALRTVPVQLRAVAPGLFSLDGSGAGVAAATAIRLVLATRFEAPVPVFSCDTKGCAAVPIDVGLDAPVYLSLYGTGIRGASSADNVTVTIGETRVKPLYAGPQNQLPGLDQVNIPLPLTLRGSGLQNVTVTVDGAVSNAVQIRIQ